MKKEDKAIWLVLFAMQWMFCITFLIFAYDGNIEGSAICSDRVSKAVVEQDNAITTPMSVEQQQKLLKDNKVLHQYMHQSLNSPPVLMRMNSLIIAVILLLSIGVEAIIFWRIVQAKATGSSW